MFGLLLILSLTTSLVLQSQFPVGWVPGGMRPPLVLCLALYYALNHSLLSAVIVAFAGGLLLDALSLVPLGYSALFMGGMVVLASRYRQQVLTEAPVTASFFGAMVGVGYPLFLVLSLLANGYEAARLNRIVMRVVMSGLLAAVSAPLIFKVMTVLHRSLNLLDKEEGDRVNA